MLALAWLACSGPWPGGEPPVAEPQDTQDTHDTEWPGLHSGGSPSVTLVHDGRVVSDGDAITLDTAPAGLDHPVDVQLTLTNRSDHALDLQGDWGIGAHFGWADAPPVSLEPGESAGLSLVVNAVDQTGATELTDALSVPGADLRVALSAAVPEPLRVVLVGEGGYVAVSDSYGAAFEHERVPADATTQRHTVAWGDGQFFRGFASGGDWSDPGRYQVSADGLEWTDLVANDAFWPSECEYALGGFVCAWSAGIALAQGGGVVHETVTWGQMFHGLAVHDDVLVFAGRGGRISTSTDALTWDHESSVSDDRLYDVAYGDGVWVVVGGSNRYAVATSTDGAVSWTYQVLHEQTYAELQRVVHDGERFVASGQAGDNLLASADGLTWTAIPDAPDLNVLGVVEGCILATYSPWQATTSVHRSCDSGETWVQVHEVPDLLTVSDLAVQTWE